MAQQGEFRFLGMTMLVGFAGMAFLLWQQRKILNKYGYELHVAGTEIDNDDISTLLNGNGDPRNPADQNAVRLSKMLGEWRKTGRKADHRQIDTGQDNRFLILKNEVHIPAQNGRAAINRVDYYFYGQDLHGNYIFQKINEPDLVLPGIKGETFSPYRITQIKRDKTITDNLANPANNGQHQIQTDRPSVDPALVEQWKNDQGKGLMLFGALAAASKAPGLLQQAIGSGTYALMNAAGAKAREGGGIGGVLKESIKPLRTKLDL